MAKCRNCGRPIREDAENALCTRCAKCTNLFEAYVQRLKYSMFCTARSSIFIAVIAAILRLSSERNIARLVSTILLYYALATLLIGSASNLSHYIQLRLALKKEHAEQE